MNYYIDTEFLEGTQKKRFFGMPYGNTPPTIDLISIGIVSEHGSEYYAISKEFNLEEAWHRYDDKPEGKVYWIRDNVLMSIYRDHVSGDMRNNYEFTYPTMRWIISKYGKTRKQISTEINQFISIEGTKNYEDPHNKARQIDFYGYYSDYDWVAFCWIFGKMMNLPKGFPMFCNDLKQEFDNKAKYMTSHELSKLTYPCVQHNVLEYLSETGQLDHIDQLKKAENYPKQQNEHNALSDARWNKKLHEFISQL